MSNMKDPFTFSDILIKRLENKIPSFIVNYIIEFINCSNAANLDHEWLLTRGSKGIMEWPFSGEVKLIRLEDVVKECRNKRKEI